MTGRRLVFEPLSVGQSSGKHVIGYVSIPRQMSRVPVYDGAGRGPDLGSLQGLERHIWVKSSTVHGTKKYGRTNQVIRPATDPELFAIWDYEGKSESKFWPTSHTQCVMNQRLRSPPAAMLRSFAYCAGDFLCPEWPPIAQPSPPVGKTSDVPFSPLELKGTTRVKAAQADNAEVDLSQWDEFIEDDKLAKKMAKTKAILRRFVAKWWRVYQERVAMEWLENHCQAQTHAEQEHN